jgi:hypothetical protein
MPEAPARFRRKERDFADIVMTGARRKRSSPFTIARSSCHLRRGLPSSINDEGKRRVPDLKSTVFLFNR